MLGRRDVLGLLAAVVAGGTRSQPARLPRIGYLSLPPLLEPPSPERQALLDGLRQFGYVPGRTAEIVNYSAQNEVDFIEEVARDLVRQKPDVIVASGALMVSAAKMATSSIPIVMVALGDPVGIGAARSLARPEGNVTGLSHMSTELAGKRVQLIRDLLPAARRIAVLWDVRNANARGEAAGTSAAIKQLGLIELPFALASEAELSRAFDGIRDASADALYVVFEGGTVASHRTMIAEFGLRQRLPVVSGWSSLTDAGALASYAPDLAATFRRAAYYVHRILNGARPGDLPIEQPVRVELVLNLRTANALGLTIPMEVLARADRRVE